MKRSPYLHYITHRIFCQALSLLLLFAATVISGMLFNSAPANATSSANNFYFENAEYDYYLTRAEDGTSRLHVKEVLTAIFPETDQNHGITRAIPYANQDGKNRTVSQISDLNLTVLRNGQPENIAKTEDNYDSYIFYFGNSSEYLHGKQTYTLEYDFKNVITQYDATGNATWDNKAATVQELYWDTNGTDWSQRFNQLTARVHIPADLAKNLGSEVGCFVGAYGESGEDRCIISMDDETTFSTDATISATTNTSSVNASSATASADTATASSTSTSSATAPEMIYTFKTANLTRGENLTFGLTFLPNTFYVPAPPQSYKLIIITTIVALLCILIIILFANHWIKNGRANKNYYKSLFVAPQYSAPTEYAVAEAAELYMKPTENSYVATILELAISKKISIINSGETKILKQKKWALQINDIANITDSQEDLLRIMNNGKKIQNGDTIKIEKHTATSSLAALAALYRSDAVDNLNKSGYLAKAAKKRSKFLPYFIFIFVFFGLTISIEFSSVIAAFVDGFSPANAIIVGADFLPYIMIAVGIITIIICIILSSQTRKYRRYTKKGLDAVNYLDGLKLYITMAEKDRLAFLQSVKGADVSPKGIVKLYEKLLPYACIFGAEESWLNELSKYCQEINYNPSWYPDNDITSFYVMNSIISSVNRSVTASTSYSPSTGTGSSSSSSGFSGGGGGFSGGGGGGGGGGGW